MESHDVAKLRTKREVMFAKAKLELSIAENLHTRSPSYEEVQELKGKLTELVGNFEMVQT